MKKFEIIVAQAVVWLMGGRKEEQGFVLVLHNSIIRIEGKESTLVLTPRK